MREAVAVPTFKRAELLYLCLETIRSIDSKIDIHVFPDKGTGKDEQAISEKFGTIQHLTWATTYHGNTANLMEIYKWASTRVDRLFIIEDDAIIEPTFFSWCREALDRCPEMFAACAFQYSPQALIGEGPDVKIPWYLSVASALPQSSLQSIAAHATLRYYSEMQEYVDASFPQSPNRGSLHFEQDGLVLRVMQSQSKRCIWPRRPRVTHVGFHGYHMGENKMSGTLEERVSLLRLAVKNPAILQQIMSGGQMPNLVNCVRCQKPLVSERSGLLAECVQCFHTEHPAAVKTASSHYYLRSWGPLTSAVV